MKKILLGALLLRLVVALLGEHGDVINYYWWSRDLWDKGLLGFYERDIANAMRPTYPPITSYLFFASAGLHEVIRQISWFINVNVHLFPSNFIFWLEAPSGRYFVNKLPAIFADLAIAWLIFVFVKEIASKKAAILSSLAFAFSPPLWYNSSFWGQTDSLYALPLLASFWALYKKKLFLAPALFALSVLTKPTGLFVAPIFFWWWIKTGGLRVILAGTAIFLAEVYLLYLPFHPQNTLSWVVSFYQKSLGGELSYLVANAFNFWALLFGFDNRPDSSPLFGIPAYILGYAIFAAFVGMLIYFLWKIKPDTKVYLFAAVIFAFAAFLFLPRVHERYFYLVLPFLAVLLGLDKKFAAAFWILSGVHLANLYHFWWVPRINFLVELLSARIVEQVLILANFAVFFWLLRIFQKKYAKA